MGRRKPYDMDPSVPFTRVWGRHNVKTWWQYLNQLKDSKLDLLEVGIFEAWTSCWFLDNLLTHPESTYTGIDAWQARDNTTSYWHDDEEGRKRWEIIESRARRNLEKHGPKAKVLKGVSAYLLRDMLRQPVPRFDIAYVDGNHAMYEVMADVFLSWALIRTPGYLLMDDLHFGGRDKDPHRIDEALGCLLACTEGHSEVLYRQQIAVVKKL